MTDPSALTNLLSETMAALESLRGTESVAGEGVAADGLIVVRTGLPGRVTGIDLSPSVLGMPVEELAAELTTAVNASLADLQSQAGLPSGAVDLDALGARLQDLQARTTRQFAAFTETLIDAQAALARRAGDPR